MMGQIVRGKKRGRPAKADLVSPPPDRDVRRSHRRRNVKYVFDLDDYFDEDEVFADDEDQRLREKKLKHLLKLQNGAETDSTPPQSRRVDHAPPYSSDDGDKPPAKKKKRKIDDEIDDEYVDEENDGEENEEEDDEEVVERKQEPKAEEDSPPGTPVEARSGLPLPDKKTLELILDKLQKKDIYGVYAEPVDPEELPDYHDVIENPMDFATVRSKLGNGSYATFEQFESDVFLICSNAMQYNTPDTIYYKQARTIQELAKRKFHKIRLNVERSEKEIKPEQKMRSTSISKKPIKKSVSRTVQEPIGSDFSSGATLATPGDLHNVTNAPQSVLSEKHSTIDGLFEGNAFLIDNNLDKPEESLPGKGPVSRFGRKPFVQDENRRATYSISLAHHAPTSESLFSTFEGETETKQLVPVGLYSDHSYARSLTRFTATLGSVAWKVASRRIEQALPQGFKFGRGWVGEYEPLPTPILMLENRNVKEPPFFAKLQPAADTRKFEKVPVTRVSSNESPRSVSFLEQKSPFLDPPGIIRNVPEIKPSFFLSPGMRPILQSRPFVEPDKKIPKQVELNCPPPSFNSNTANRQISKSLEMEASRTKSDNKRIPKQVELNSPPSFNRNAPDPINNNRQISKNSESEASRTSVDPPSFSKNTADPINNRQVSKNSETEASRPTRNINFSPSGSFKRPDSKPVNYYPTHDQQGQGLTDPVQLMRMLAEKSQNQQKPTSSNNLPSDSNSNAAAVAARAWMSAGAGSGGFIRPGAADNNAANINKNHQILYHADSLYNNSTRSPLHGFVPQGHNTMPMPMHMPVMVGGNEMQFQNQQRMVFPQMATADLSRFQMQQSSPWRNLTPQMHTRQKQEMLPPDLNIGFQSSGSPGRPSSGVLVDSQQPDLALQL